MQIGNLTIKNRLCIAPLGEGYHGLAGPHGEYSELGIEPAGQGRLRPALPGLHRIP